MNPNIDYEYFIYEYFKRSKKYYKDSIREMKKYIDEDFEEYIKENNIDSKNKKEILIRNLIDKYANRGALNSEININNHMAKNLLFVAFVCLSISFVFYFSSQGEKINTSKMEIKNVVNIKRGE